MTCYNQVSAQQQEMEAVGIRVHSLEAELARVLGLKQEEAARAEAEVGVLKAKLHKLDGELATTREAARQVDAPSLHVIGSRRMVLERGLFAES